MHEQIGQALFDEGVIEKTLDLKKRVLKKGGRILPGRFELFLEPAGVKDDYRVPYLWQTKLPGLDFSAVRDLPGNDADRHGYDWQGGESARAAIDYFLGDASPMLAVDLNQINDATRPHEPSRRRGSSGAQEGWTASVSTSAWCLTARSDSIPRHFHRGPAGTICRGCPDRRAPHREIDGSGHEARTVCPRAGRGSIGRMTRLWHLLYIAVIAGLVFVITRPAKADPLTFQAALIAHTRNYDNITWLGKPIWQPVLDVWTLQETMFEIKPELLIECGTYKGGSRFFFGDLFELMGKGRVITVDIIKLHELSHPRVTYLIGDCAAPEIVQQIRAERDKVTGPVMVVLDSDHKAAPCEKGTRRVPQFRHTRQLPPRSGRRD